MAKLLVSVRSAAEAGAALAGGADVIDVKEPLRGALGRARVEVWRAVREAVPASVAVSVALGELSDWSDRDATQVSRSDWNGLAYCKLGLSDAAAGWVDRWRDLRRRLAGSGSFQPAWVAVVYVDWQAAGAPDPDSVIDVACTIDACRGVLFDTWDKSRRLTIDLDWKPQVDRVRARARFVALAGSLDVDAIGRLAPLSPDLFAVRSAACRGGDRFGPVDPRRVAELARAARDVPATTAV